MIRRVDGQTGAITTVAGNGQTGFGGDGGPATLASFADPIGIYASEAGDIFIADQSNHRIRRVDGQTGIITTIAGNGLIGFAGDGGLATSARLNTPQGVSADLGGNVYIADTANRRVRKVTAAGIISTIAGTGIPTSTGDGGSALLATLSSPRRLTADFAGNVFILDRATNARVRKIDGTTGIITTVAGGGVLTGDSGPATQMNLGAINDVAMENGGTLLVASAFRLWRIEADTATAIAGTGIQGFGGDGGDPFLANFNNLSGVCTNAIGEIVLSDRSNQRIRKITLSQTQLDELIITLQTLQSLLDQLQAIEGSLIMADVAGRTTLIAGVLASIGLDFIVTGNGDLVILNTPGLLSIGGVLQIENNLVLSQIALPSIVVIGGDVFINNNPGATEVDLSGLGSVGGDVSVEGNSSVGQVDLSGLGSVGGNVSVENNPAATEIDLSGLGTVGGDVSVEGNSSSTTAALAAAKVADALANEPALPVATVSLGSLQTVGGSLTVANNGAAFVEIGPSLSLVGGNLMVNTGAQDTLDVGNAVVSGNVSLFTQNAATVIAKTGFGSTSVTMRNAAFAMALDLVPGTFPNHIAFSITNSGNLPPEPGTDPDGLPAVIDPLHAYQFNFANPTLGVPASLSFQITLANLDPTTRQEVLDAIAAGRITLATKDTEPGSAYHAFPVCVDPQEPTAAGCVRLDLLDQNGQPTTGTPAIVRFTALVGHFSTWGVVIFSAPAATPTATPTDTPTATPTNTPTPSSITSFDSALIAKHVISSPPLKGNKLGAAEVSGDCSVSSLDAAQIASYVTNDGGPIGTTGTTIDPPGPCGALPVSTPVLMGDVSGTAPVTTAGSGSASASLPNISATPKNFTDIPIIVSDLTGLGVLSYDIQITFDPSVVTPNFVTPVVTAGTISAAMTVTTNISNPGHLIISAYGDAPLTGSGALLVLQFGTSFSGQTALTFEDYTDSGGAGSHVHRGFLFNEGTPTVTLTNGSITLLGGPTPTNTPTPSETPSISGTITYGNAIGNPVPPRFVKNVSIASTVGSPAVGPVITGTPGTYTLTGFGAGSYTIKPTKPGGSNGAITSNDAARIAQGVSGALPFVSNNQRFAADTTGNGGISSQDAAKLAQFVAGLPFSPPNFTGEWRFFTSNLPAFPAGAHPQERTYASVTSNVTGEDYIGVLIGETSGNWNPATHPRPAGRAAGKVDSGKWKVESDLNAECGMRNAECKDIAVELPQMVTSADKEIVVPVTVQGVEDKGIISYEFDLRYDPSVMQPLENPVDVAGTVSRGLMAVANPYEPGLLRVVVYGAMPIDSDGLLLNLRFTAVGAAGSVSPLMFERIMFNEGDPATIVTDGRVELSAAAEN